MVKETRDNGNKKVLSQVPQHSIEFMLSEYQRLNTLYQTQVERGERRVEFLITAVSALFGFLAVLSQLAIQMEFIVIITITSLTVLSLFGLLTLNRLINRAATMRFHMTRMSAVRNYFIDLDKNISNYLNLSRQPPQTKNKVKNFFQRVIREILDRSGLIETVILLNSIMIGALVTAIIYYYNGLSLNSQQIILTSALSFLISGTSQFIFSRFVASFASSVEK